MLNTMYRAIKTVIHNVHLLLLCIFIWCVFIAGIVCADWQYPQLLRRNIKIIFKMLVLKRCVRKNQITESITEGFGKFNRSCKTGLSIQNSLFICKTVINNKKRVE